VPGRDGFVLPDRGVLFLCIPDAALAGMAERIASMHPARDLAIVHTSGALGLDVLAALRPNAVGSFHPLQPFPAPRPPSAFRGITIAIDASTPALARRLGVVARRLGATARRVDSSQRARYHASAVFASSFLTVVVAEAVRLLQGVGWSEKDSLAALMPLIEGSLENIRRRGPVHAMTGPLRRGDAETVARHLEGIDNADLYRMLGLVALRIAAEAGLDPAAAERTKRALSKRALTPTGAATRRRRSI
jgi:predicted short-subunit dehydrogenase-like oxidoreductase (DUF2520 family)